MHDLKLTFPATACDPTLDLLHMPHYIKTSPKTAGTNLDMTESVAFVGSFFFFFFDTMLQNIPAALNF